MKTPKDPIPTEAEREEDSNAAEWPASEHAMFLPPWREHFASSAPVEYGPRTALAYQRRIHEHENERRGAIDSGSLYDVELEAESSKRMPARNVERHDAERFEARIGVLAPTLPKRELQAAVHFWRDGLSVSRIATSMQVAKATVRTWIKRVRDRLERTKRP